MMDQLDILLGGAQSSLWLGFVTFLRIGAMVAIFPAFGEQSVPIRVKLGLAIAFCIIVTPLLGLPAQPVTDDLVARIMAVIPEIMTGVFFGLMLRFLIFVLQITGSIAAQSTSLSQIFGGSAGVDPQPAMGHVLVVAGLALAVISGLHVQFVAYILQTYELVPVGAILDAEVAVNIGVMAVARTFALGFTLAAPFVIASVIYNVTLGVINKAMPQLMVSFVGAPAVTAGGMLLLFVTAPYILSTWLDVLLEVTNNPIGGWE